MDEIEPVVEKKSFRKELCDLINWHCHENQSDTPDFILTRKYAADLISDLIADKGEA